MVIYIFFLISLIFSLQIIRLNGYKRVFWVILGLLILNGKIMLYYNPDFPIERWLIYSLIVSELIRIKSFTFNIRTYPLFNQLVFISICILLIGILDSTLSYFNKVYIPLVYFTSTMFIIFLGYVSIKKAKDINLLLKRILYISLILFAYGVFNFITQSNPYYELVVLNYEQEFNVDKSLSYIDGDINRYRVASTMNMTFNYGYASAVFLLLSLYLFSQKVITKRFFIATFVAGLGGVILCASRIVLGASIVSSLLLFSMSYNLKDKFKVLVFLPILFVIIYSFVPVFQERIDVFVDVFFTGGESVEGSSIGMRIDQFFASLKFFVDAPITGNGFFFINRILGWGTENYDGDIDLAGFESYIFVLIIEQGIIGLVVAYVFFKSVLKYLNIKRRNQYRISELGISLIVLFLFFAIGTGTLGSWAITMLLLGAIIKSVNLESTN